MLRTLLLLCKFVPQTVSLNLSDGGACAVIENCMPYKLTAECNITSVYVNVECSGLNSPGRVAAPARRALVPRTTRSRSSAGPWTARRRTRGWRRRRRTSKQPSPRNQLCATTCTNSQLTCARGEFSEGAILQKTLFTSLVISKSAVGRSPTLLIQERSRKKYIAIVNDVCLLAAILSDLCNNTDTDLLYILSIPKLYCKCVANNMNFNPSLTIWMPPSCKRTTCHVTETAGIVFLIPKKWERSRGNKPFS